MGKNTNTLSLYWLIDWSLKQNSRFFVFQGATKKIKATQKTTVLSSKPNILLEQKQNNNNTFGRTLGLELNDVFCVFPEFCCFCFLVLELNNNNNLELHIYIIYTYKTVGFIYIYHVKTCLCRYFNTYIQPSKPGHGSV